MVSGITLHHVGEHSRGLQAVRVHTRRGWVVLASDSLHFYDNLLKANPFPILIDVGQVLAAGQKVLPLADSGDHVIPGHDPAVMRLFPTYPCAADAVDVSAPPLQSTPLAGVKPGRLFPKAFPS